LPHWLAQLGWVATMQATLQTMVRLPLIAVLLLLVHSVAAQSVQRETLGSGLTLVLREQTVTRAVELMLVLRSGPLYEGERLGSGISALLQQVLMDGARSGRLGEPLRPLAERLRTDLDLASTLSLIHI